MRAFELVLRAKLGLVKGLSGEVFNVKKHPVGRIGHLLGGNLSTHSRINSKTMKTLALAFMIGGLVTGSAQTTLPYFQDFENPTFPPTGWQTFPIGSPDNWERDTVSGYGLGTACTSFDNYNIASGYYGLRLPWMDFTNVNLPCIQFDIAYAKRPTGNPDAFGFWWSNNGTSNWQSLGNLASNLMITAPDTADPFVPTATQWATRTLCFATLAHRPYVRLAFEDVSANGNLIYIDNVSVFDSAPSGLGNALSPTTVVSPIPFSSSITADAGDGEIISRAELFSFAGNKVAAVEPVASRVTLDGLSDLPAGIYVLRLTTDAGQSQDCKVVKL